MVTLKKFNVLEIPYWNRLRQSILILSDLNWTPHVENICSKLVGLLYRQFYINASSDAMIKLHTAVLKQQLEYAAEAWDPQAYGRMWNY